MLGLLYVKNSKSKQVKLKVENIQKFNYFYSAHYQQILLEEVTFKSKALFVSLLYTSDCLVPVPYQWYRY